ncbi:MAG: peptidase M3, partial [Pseudomonadota bacterium]
MTNPLLDTWTTPFELPPFDRIADADFEPAVEAAMEAARGAVLEIAGDPAEPTFANTIEALERSDALLSRVAAVFYSQASTDTNDVIKALERDLSP